MYNGEINTLVEALKIKKSHIFRNTKLKSKGRRNASTFNKLLLVSSLYTCFSPIINYIIMWQII